MKQKLKRSYFGCTNSGKRHFITFDEATSGWSGVKYSQLSKHRGIISVSVAFAFLFQFSQKISAPRTI